MTESRPHAAGTSGGRRYARAIAEVGILPNSQFNSPGKIRPDGTVLLTGTVALDEPGKDPEIRFLIIQNDLVVEGRGRGDSGSGSWSGRSDAECERLEEGPALAIGLGLVSRDATPGVGFQTVTWSAQIELKRRGDDE
jgi:hypothetical protein